MHEVGHLDIKGVNPRMQDDNFASKPSGIMEVAMWLSAHVTSWALINAFTLDE